MTQTHDGSSTSAPAPAPARKGRTRSEGARTAILEATRDELAERGYDKLSIDRIAAAAGAGKQTVYRWYPSKSALVAECLLQGLVLTPVLDLPDTGDVRHDIAAWVEGFVQNSHGQGGSLIRAATAASAEDAEVAARFQEQVTAITQDSLVARIEVGVAAGQLRADLSAPVVAETIIGALLYRILTRQDLTNEFATQVLDIAFTGITT